MSEDAEDALGAVADETRVRILRELWDADGALAFSELRDRVDVRDSGRFNYHLGKLRGRFVEQTDDGYDLQYAGRRLVGALHSGVYTDDATVEPAPVDGTCGECGGGLEAAYEDESGRVTCTDCGIHVLLSELPPGFVEGREDDLPAALDTYLRTLLWQATEGFCHLCLGQTAGRLEQRDGRARAIIECERCGATFRSDLGTTVLEHPDVVSFYREHGENLREHHVWELDWEESGVRETADGRRGTVTIELGGDELALAVNDDLDVVAVEGA